LKFKNKIELSAKTTVNADIKIFIERGRNNIKLLGPHETVNRSSNSLLFYNAIYIQFCMQKYRIESSVLVMLANNLNNGSALTTTTTAGKTQNKRDSTDTNYTSATYNWPEIGFHRQLQSLMPP